MSDEPISTPDPPTPPPAPPPSLSPSPEEIGAPEPIPGPERGSVWAGIGLLALLHLIQIPLLFVAGIFWIGLSQLVYVVPAAIILMNKRRTATANGLWIGAGITFLINGACFGLLFWQMGSTNFH